MVAAMWYSTSCSLEDPSHKSPATGFRLSAPFRDEYQNFVKKHNLKPTNKWESSTGFNVTNGDSVQGYWVEYTHSGESCDDSVKEAKGTGVEICMQNERLGSTKIHYEGVSDYSHVDFWMNCNCEGAVDDTQDMYMDTSCLDYTT